MVDTITMPVSDRAEWLQRELDTYERLEEELLNKSLGQYVLIQGDQLVGTYNDKEEALYEGYRLFPVTPFAVIEVAKPESAILAVYPLEGQHMPNYHEQEIRTFEANRDWLMAEGEGKFALIHGDDVRGIYDTSIEAARDGYRDYGDSEPFIVMQIQSEDEPDYLPPGTLGL